jgi:hypothetical protein
MRSRLQTKGSWLDDLASAEPIVNVPAPLSTRSLEEAMISLDTWLLFCLACVALVATAGPNVLYLVSSTFT